jgi:hypothetical protein
MSESAAEYCRALEAYLCQKNEGHLIRIVGPVFEQVCGWAEQGVPLAVARKGIDRYCERYYAKGPRRRPVRIEFCEADILEEFDAWRRAVGVASAGAAASAAASRDTLAAHIDRAIARLTALRAGGRYSAAFDGVVAEGVRELDTVRAGAKQARGSARAAIIERLAALDARLQTAAAGELDEAARARLRAEADEEVLPFAARMTPAARSAAAAAAYTRLVREAMGLPVITFE